MLWVFPLSKYPKHLTAARKIRAKSRYGTEDGGAAEAVAKEPALAS